MLRNKTFIAALSLLIALAGPEFYLRLFPVENSYITFSGMFDVDPCWLSSLKPNLREKPIKQPDGSIWKLSTNEARFRINDLANPATPAIGPHDTLRIVTVGGSSTMAWGVNDADAWPAVLERLLREDPIFDRPVEVLNFGAGARGTGAPLIRGYYCYIVPYKPNLVIRLTQPLPNSKPISKADYLAYTLPPPDDWRDNSLYYVDQKGFLKAYVYSAQTLKVLMRHSALFRYLTGRVRSTLMNRADIPRRIAEQAEQSEATLNDVLPFYHDLRESGIAYIHLIREGHYYETYEAQGFLKPDPWGKFQRRLEANGILTLNTTNRLRDDRDKHLLSDGHWSAEANRIVAQELHDFLLTNRAHIKNEIRR